jgi:hypothetical protein
VARTPDRGPTCGAQAPGELAGPAARRVSGPTQAGPADDSLGVLGTGPAGLWQAQLEPADVRYTQIRRELVS